MDRFKFRVWDIKQQKYRQRTHHEADTCINCLSGKVLFGEGIEIYGEEDDKDVTLEQCTGLEDKNGKLIYEKDLVTKGDDIYEVNWCHQKQGYVFRNLNCIDDVLESLDITINEWEVIGNIHENADLLGEE